jgi:GntR family transcriptional regulator
MAVRLHIQIDTLSGLPVYRQIMDQIKYYIASGSLVTGDQLPSIRELAQALTVNPTTVVKAYTELVHEAVIELRHGKGAFVASGYNPLSVEQQDKAVRRIARQLAVETAQMGMSPERALRIVEEELGAISSERAEAKAPVKLKVVASGSRS